MTNLIWNEPEERNGWNIAPKSNYITFGSDISEKFNEINNIKTIIRSHTLIMSGYEWTHNRNILTIFSAPNYWGRWGNLGAIAEIDEHLNINLVELWSRSGEIDEHKE